MTAEAGVITVLALASVGAVCALIWIAFEHRKFMTRNDEVYDLRKLICNKAYTSALNDIENVPKYLEIYHRMPSYGQMLKSKKPLDLNEWLSKEEQQLLGL